MSRRFKSVDYEAMLDTTVRLGDCLPAQHLARFVADIVSHLDLSSLYARYGTRGGEPYAPEILVGLLFYGYATGVFASRKIEQGTKETAALRFLAGNLSPDHDTIANFRRTFLPELKGLFVQTLLLAREAGFLELGNISLDGTKVHADASKSKAVSYKRLIEIEARLAAEIDELFALAERADQRQVPEGMDLPAEIARREDRLRRLAEAKVVLQARAAERFAAEQAEFEAKQRDRQAHEERTGKRPRGRPPEPPKPGPKDADQFNFTDPDSRIMKNSHNDGFDQHYNAQVAVDQDALLIVGCSISNHPNDQAEVAPTMGDIPAELGAPATAVLDTGYFSEANVRLLEEAGIDPYIATGRTLHHGGWRAFFEDLEEADPPPEGATLREQMAYKLRTTLGKMLYRRRKCTVEPAIGQIKEAMGFRQFSLRGLPQVEGEWRLVCLAFNLRRIHTMAHTITPKETA